MNTLFFSEEKLLNTILLLTVMFLSNTRRVFYTLCVIIFWLFLIIFYRDYPTNIDYKYGTIYSPSNGTVLSTENNTLIIFLSVFDTHIQKFPVNGIIRDITYNPGEFNLAYLLDKTIHNERVITSIEDTAGDIITIAQVAGQLARRIVYWKNVGDNVIAGENLGMIKFGSQIILKVPDDYGILVNPGDRVTIGMPIYQK